MKNLSTPKKANPSQNLILFTRCKQNKLKLTAKRNKKTVNKEINYLINSIKEEKDTQNLISIRQYKLGNKAKEAHIMDFLE